MQPTPTQPPRFRRRPRHDPSTQSRHTAKKGSGHERPRAGRPLAPRHLRLPSAFSACSRLFAIFAQLRFQSEMTYKAEFTNVTGLRNGHFVRIAGVEVGKVKNISIQPDTTVLVEFSADHSVVLTEGSRAAIRYDDLIGGRYLALEEGAGGPEAHRGRHHPVDRTSPALDLDALIGGFRPLFRALDPDQVNAFTGQLIAAFQGQGATIGSFLAQTAALTNTLADRDQLIGQVITNLNSVLGSLGDQNTSSPRPSTRCHSWSRPWPTARRTSATVAYANAAAGSIADLLRRRDRR